MRLTYENPEDVGLDPRRLGDVLGLVEEWHARDAFPGAVFLIARSGVIVAHERIGHAVKVPFEREMTENAIFDVASLTKVVATATSVMSLVEQGRIGLSDPVEDFLPGIGWKHKEVTILQLLTHTAGLDAHKPLHELGGKEHIIDAICKMEQAYEPGTRVIYSDLGYMLLGEVVREASGRALDLYARGHVFEVLGMKDTLFNPPKSLGDRMVATEMCPWRKRVMMGQVHDEKAYAMGGVAGHAGLFSTACDLAILGQAFLNLGECDGGRILSPPTVMAMTRNRTPGLDECRGLGWQIKSEYAKSSGDLLSDRAYGHTGFTGVSLWIDPSYELAVVLMTNRVHPTRENTLLLDFRPIFHNAVVSAIVKPEDRS